MAGQLGYKGLWLLGAGNGGATLTVDFTANTTTPATDEVVTLTASGDVGTGYYHLWTWGDGEENLVEDAATASHAWSAAGEYNVGLYVINKTADTYGYKTKANYISAEGFSPLSLDPVIWVESDSGITSSASAVSQWADKSPEGNNLTQSAGASQPTYNSANSAFNGEPTIDFDGTDDFLSTMLSASATTCTQTIVFRVNSVPVLGSTVIGSENANDKRYWWRNTSDTRYRNGGTTEAIGTYISDPYVISIIWDTGTTVTWYTNSASAASGTISNSSQTALVSIGDTAALARAADVEIAAFFQTNQALSSAQVGELHTYFNDKYALY